MNAASPTNSVPAADLRILGSPQDALQFAHALFHVALGLGLGVLFLGLVVASLLPGPAWVGQAILAATLASTLLVEAVIGVFHARVWKAAGHDPMAGMGRRFLAFALVMALLVVLATALRLDVTPLTGAGVAFGAFALLRPPYGFPRGRPVDVASAAVYVVAGFGLAATVPTGIALLALQVAGFVLVEACAAVALVPAALRGAWGLGRREAVPPPGTALRQ